MTTGTGKMSKAKMSEERRSSKSDELKAARAKSPEKPMKSKMEFAAKAHEHLKHAEHHHKEAKKLMAKVK